MMLMCKTKGKAKKEITYMNTKVSQAQGCEMNVLCKCDVHAQNCAMKMRLPQRVELNRRQNQVGGTIRLSACPTIARGELYRHEFQLIKTPNQA